MRPYTISERLQELANLLGINQTEMRERLGFSKSTFSNYWNGNREPKQNIISYIAEKYNVSESWLMGFDVPMRVETNTDADAILDAKISNDFELKECIRKYYAMSEKKQKLVRDYINLLDEE